MDGIQIEFTESGNLVFTADEETRAAIREFQADQQNSVAWATKQVDLARTAVQDAWALGDPVAAANKAAAAQRKLTMAQLTLQSCASRASDENVFLEHIEYYLCNGYSLVSPEDIGALWGGLIIANGTLDDETTPEEATQTKVWAYDYYVTRSYLQDLLDTGRMVWTLYPWEASNA